MPTTQLRMLGLVFPGFNMMDLTGPMEVFGNSRIPADTRHITIASATDITSSSETVHVKRDVSFIELLATQTGGEMELASYDVLVMPGAAPTFLDAAIEKDGGLLRVLGAFAQLDTSERPRWLFSVCSGAGFLGAAGLLGGRVVTTHWSYLDGLKEVCARVETEVEVVRKRWVDAGKTATGVRVVTAGGVSCGIDAALWIASQIYGLEKAVTVAQSMDYDWKYGRVDVTDGYIV